MSPQQKPGYGQEINIGMKKRKNGNTEANLPESTVSLHG
jgi:hypothetical protein